MGTPTRREQLVQLLSLKFSPSREVAPGIFSAGFDVYGDPNADYLVVTHYTPTPGGNPTARDSWNDQYEELLSKFYPVRREGGFLQIPVQEPVDRNPVDRNPGVPATRENVRAVLSPLFPAAEERSHKRGVTSGFNLYGPDPDVTHVTFYAEPSGVNEPLEKKEANKRMWVPRYREALEPHFKVREFGTYLEVRRREALQDPSKALESPQKAPPVERSPELPAEPSTAFSVVGVIQYLNGAPGMSGHWAALEAAQFLDRADPQLVPLTGDGGGSGDAACHHLGLPTLHYSLNKDREERLPWLAYGGSCYWPDDRHREQWDRLMEECPQFCRVLGRLPPPFKPNSRANRDRGLVDFLLQRKAAGEMVALLVLTIPGEDTQHLDALVACTRAAGIPVHIPSCPEYLFRDRGRPREPFPREKK